MDHVASFLNMNGGQKIAMLSMSVSGSDKEITDHDDERVRLPKIGSIAKEARIDCSWGNEDTKPRKSRKKVHLFAEINVSRGFDEDEGGEPERPDTTGDQDGPIISRWDSQALSKITFFNFFLQDLATSPVKRMVCLHGLVRSCLSSFIYEGFVGMISLPMAPLLSACV